MAFIPRLSSALYLIGGQSFAFRQSILAAVRSGSCSGARSAYVCLIALVGPSLFPLEAACAYREASLIRTLSKRRAEVADVYFTAAE